MASVPATNAYDAAKLNISVAYLYIPASASQAASNFGTDFRVASGANKYQVQIRSDGVEHISSNTTLYRMRVTILIHHLRTSLADEASFMNVTTSRLQLFLTPAVWRTQPHIYDVVGDPDEDRDGDLEIDDIEREGNVLTWTYGITLLVDNL